jgi:glycosyltransferase involved in cell wall biosynthesis
MFTLTSSSETFSLAALEAMSFGLPCSLTDVGGASEMILEGKTGVLSKPLDINSIARSWSDILNGNFDKQVIRKNIEYRFDIEKMFKKYITTICS